MSEDEAERLVVALHTSAWTMWLMFLEKRHKPLVDGDERQQYLEWSTNKLELWVNGDVDPPSDYCTCYEMICDYADVLPELQKVELLRYMTDKLRAHGTAESYNAEIKDILEKHGLRNTLSNRVRAQRAWAAQVSYGHYNDIIAQMLSRASDSQQRDHLLQGMQELLQFFTKVLEEIDTEPRMPALPDPPQDTLGESSPEVLPAAPPSETNGVLVSWPSEAPAVPSAHQRSIIRRTSIKDNLTHTILQSKQEAEVVLEADRKKRKKNRLRFSSVSQRRKKKKQPKARVVFHERGHSFGLSPSASSAAADPKTGLVSSQSGGSISIRYQAASPSDAVKRDGGFFRSHSGASVNEAKHRNEREEEDKNKEGDGDEEEDEEEGEEEIEENSSGSLTGSQEEQSDVGEQGKGHEHINRFALKDFVSKCWAYLVAHGCTRGMSTFLANYKFPKQTLTSSPDARAEDAINVISEHLALKPESFIYQAIRKDIQKQEPTFDERFATVRNRFLEQLNGPWMPEHDNLVARLTVYRRASEKLRDLLTSLENTFFMSFDPVGSNEQLRDIQCARVALNNAFDATVSALEDAMRSSTPIKKLGDAVRADPSFKQIQSSGVGSKNRRRNRSCITVGQGRLGDAFIKDDLAD